MDHATRTLRPLNWLFFGAIIFPCLCIVTSLVVKTLLGHVGVLHGSSASVATQLVVLFGRGRIGGLFLGMSFGVASMVTHQVWEDGDFGLARGIAGACALVFGGLWVMWLWKHDPMLWLIEFGFVVPPLAWASGLLLFACGARHGRASV